MRAGAARGFSTVFLLLFLLGAGKVLGKNRSGGEAPIELGSSWSEDLAEDRSFERSLIPRELAAIILIAILIAVRQLLS